MLSNIDQGIVDMGLDRFIRVIKRVDESFDVICC